MSSQHDLARLLSVEEHGEGESEAHAASSGAVSTRIGKHARHWKVAALVVGLVAAIATIALCLLTKPDSVLSASVDVDLGALVLEEASTATSDEADEWVAHEVSSVGSHMKLIFDTPNQASERRASTPVAPAVVPGRRLASPPGLRHAAVGAVTMLFEKKNRGIEYIRKGYNLFFGNPLGKAVDEGFRADLLDADAESPKLTITRSESCNQDSIFEKIKSVKKYEEALGSNVEVESNPLETVSALAGVVPGVGTATKVALGAVKVLAAAKFQANQDVKSTRDSLVEGKIELSLESAKCETYRVNVNAVDKPSLTAGFKSSLSKAMSASDAAQRALGMKSLFDTFGTHYAMQMTMGYRWISETQYINNRESEAESSDSKTGHSGSVLGVSRGSEVTSSHSASSSFSHAKRNHAAWTLGCVANVEVYGDFVSECGASDRYMPVPISYKLEPISMHPELTNDEQAAVNRGYLDYCVMSTTTGCPPYDCVKAVGDWCPTTSCQNELVDQTMMLMFFRKLGSFMHTFQKPCLTETVAKMKRETQKTVGKFYFNMASCIALRIEVVSLGMVQKHVNTTCPSLGFKQLAANTKVTHTKDYVLLRNVLHLKLVQLHVLKKEAEKKKSSWFFR